MLHYAIQNEKFLEIASTSTYTYKMNEETYNWRNKHRLVRSYPSAIAGKTGFTKVAGSTLATYFEKDGKEDYCCNVKRWKRLEHASEVSSNNTFSPIQTSNRSKKRSL